MGYRNTEITYGSVAKFFHWLIFLLVVGMLIFGFLLEDVPKSYQAIAYNTHKLIGLTILMLMGLRIAWSFINPKPGLPTLLRRWQRGLAHTMHYLLYLALLIMPMAGWIGTSASGRPPKVGETALALPVTQSENISDLAFNVHNTLAIIIVVLIGIHTLAALYHHFILRDNVLMRMLPFTTKH